MGITIKDIAKRANVAISTVSRALNNKSDINPETRSKILKIMKDCGYNPNNVARGLVMRKQFSLGFVVPDISNPFFAEIAVGIEKRAKDFGYSVIFCNTDNDLQNEKDALTLMRGKMVDGLIVSLSKDCKNEVEKLIKLKLPIVQIDRKIPGINCSGVFIDNKKSAYNATRHLIECGHKSFAHFTGNLKTQTGIDRLEGFEKAVNEAGLQESNIIIKEGRYNVDSGKQCMRELINSGNIPGALFAASDLQAAGALYAAVKASIKVPDKLSIIGHDDIDLSYLISPNLSTLEQPKKKIGKLAVEMILKKIERMKDSDYDNDKDVILDTKLVIRESTNVSNR